MIDKYGTTDKKIDRVLNTKIDENIELDVSKMSNTFLIS